MTTDVIDQPIMLDAYAASEDVDILPSYMPLPGLGVLPVNAYLLRAAQPMLVDTGLGALREALVDQLARCIDLDDLRWIWVTHADADHLGALEKLLDLAPRARVVTTFLGLGKLNMMMQLSPERAHLLNPGQQLDLGDRRVEAFRPPTYDSPETTGLHDSKSGAVFSSDCFGAIMSAPESFAADIDASELHEGMIGWTTIDAPWLASLREDAFDSVLRVFERRRPTAILSSHLPPALGLDHRLIEAVRSARLAPEFVGPDQAAVEAAMGAASNVA